ncbi:MAG: hypothetical protein IT457_06075 [Planctomycetes bacterium]|nr:hypothetical protein [Planctomycetota bacterium]
MNHRSLTLCTLGIAGALSAQNYSVSPVAFATAEGNSTLSYIFTSAPNKTQQVHGDLQGSFRIITAMSFRRDGVATQTTGNPRQIDMEIAMGEANFANVGIVFGSNFTAAPTAVFTRKLVSSPDWRFAPPMAPAPFDFTLTFDAPFVYQGTTDLAWEMTNHSNNGATSDTVRVDLGSPSFTNSSTALAGTPCRATGATQDYNLLGTLGTNINPEVRWSIQGFPTQPFAANVLLVGLTDPALSIPGLCNTLRSSGEINLILPVSDANGTWTMPLIYFPYNASAVGAQFWEQAYSLDTGIGGLGVVGTRGMRLTFMAAPATGTAAKIKSVRNTTATSPTASTGQSISEGGFVVQFTH